MGGHTGGNSNETCKTWAQCIQQTETERNQNNTGVGVLQISDSR